MNYLLELGAEEGVIGAAEAGAGVQANILSHRTTTGTGAVAFADTTQTTMPTPQCHTRRTDLHMEVLMATIITHPIEGQEAEGGLPRLLGRRGVVGGAEGEAMPRLPRETAGLQACRWSTWMGGGYH